MEADWDNVAKAKGIVQNYQEPPEIGRGKDRFFPGHFREHGSANILISGFWSPEVRENIFLLS